MSGHIGLPESTGMELRGAIRRLPLAGAAVAGAAVGHSIAYLIVAPQGRSRAVLLAGTGHGYRSTFAAEIILGLLAVATFVARRFDRGLHRRRRPGGDEPWARVALRLCLLQVAIFVLQELLERVVAGSPLGELIGDRLLFVGILAQVAVAIGAATLLVLLGRAAEAVGRALGHGGERRAFRVPVERPRAARPPSSRPRGSRGIRGPPRFGIV